MKELFACQLIMPAKKKRYCENCQIVKIQVRTRCSKCDNYMRIVREG